MPAASFFEIRTCVNCGLRYPLAGGHAFGVRCPRCLGETRVVVKREFGGQIDGETANIIREQMEQKTLAVLLDNIRSAWNVGSILRSADGFGFDHAYLCGITPTPELEAVRKTALGAEEYVTWSQHPDAVKLVIGLKKEGWRIFALEYDERSQPVGRIDNTTCSVLILGSEVTGIDPELLDLADKIFHIPMRGQKRSFNVANAFSIAAYALLQQG
jgi:tRNA G18 (ribose-2'-O)-methylase SpoU